MNKIKFVNTGKGIYRGYIINGKMLSNHVALITHNNDTYTPQVSLSKDNNKKAYRLLTGRPLPSLLAAEFWCAKVLSIAQGKSTA